MLKPGGGWIFYVGEAVFFLITTGCCFHFVVLFCCRKIWYTLYIDLLLYLTEVLKMSYEYTRTCTQMSLHWGKCSTLLRLAGLPQDGVRGCNKRRHDRSNCSFNSFRPMSPATPATHGNKKLRFQTVGVPCGNTSNDNRINQPNCLGCLHAVSPNRCLAPPGICQHPQYTVAMQPDCTAPPSTYSNASSGQKYYFQTPLQHIRPDRNGQQSNNYLDSETAAQSGSDIRIGGGQTCNYQSPPPLDESGPEDVTLDDNVSSTTSGSYMVDHADVDERTTKDFPVMNATMWCV